MIIERKAFLALLEDFPEDYEAFCFIKDQLIYSSSLNLLGQHCISCQQQTHDFLSCPLVIIYYYYINILMYLSLYYYIASFFHGQLQSD